MRSRDIVDQFRRNVERDVRYCEANQVKATAETTYIQEMILKKKETRTGSGFSQRVIHEKIGKNNLQG